MVTFRNIDGSPARNIAYWYGSNSDEWPWTCSTLTLKPLNKWEIATRIAFDHAAWDYFRLKTHATNLCYISKYKELIFVVASGKDLRGSHCLQFVPMEPGRLVYSDRFREIYLKPLDKAKFGSWDEMQVQEEEYGDLLSWEDMKMEFEMAFLAAKLKIDDDDVLFKEWKRCKMDENNISWPKITFVGVKKVSG